MKHTVTFTNSQRKAVIPPAVKQDICAALELVTANEHIAEPCEISVTFVSDRRIRELNRAFRNIDRPTDVLSFPLGENGDYDTDPETGALMLGDVVISVERALAQAEEYGHSAEREIVYLSVHSMLHLLGYDHVDDPKDTAIMRRKEEAVMKAIGLERTNK